MSDVTLVLTMIRKTKMVMRRASSIGSSIIQMHAMFLPLRLVTLLWNDITQLRALWKMPVIAAGTFVEEARQ